MTDFRLKHYHTGQRIVIQFATMQLDRTILYVRENRNDTQTLTVLDCDLGSNLQITPDATGYSRLIKGLSDTQPSIEDLQRIAQLEVAALAYENKMAAIGLNRSFGRIGLGQFTDWYAGERAGYIVRFDADEIDIE